MKSSRRGRILQQQHHWAAQKATTPLIHFILTPQLHQLTNEHSWQGQDSTFEDIAGKEDYFDDATMLPS
jgi:hypothetical protein